MLTTGLLSTARFHLGPKQRRINPTPTRITALSAFPHEGTTVFRHTYTNELVGTQA